MAHIHYILRSAFFIQIYMFLEILFNFIYNSIHKIFNEPLNLLQTDFFTLFFATKRLGASRTTKLIVFRQHIFLIFQTFHLDFMLAFISMHVVYISTHIKVFPLYLRIYICECVESCTWLIHGVYS